MAFDQREACNGIDAPLLLRPLGLRCEGRPPRQAKAAAPPSLPAGAVFYSYPEAWSADTGPGSKLLQGQAGGPTVCRKQGKDSLLHTAARPEAIHTRPLCLTLGTLMPSLTETERHHRNPHGRSRPSAQVPPRIVSSRSRQTSWTA
ncbi:hypothetical protein GCM10010358_83180 [Streptomyces minutiscleroticus]|uniref:Uncharacterized protein n=1 Tax=Streptomyces minutiscleroticus TaxID=68238 RepID=A0A918UAQ7_9ACTN|nr:hypothetical protein GCM10010358_83180 [Streptomyces minutiscleroticus]